MNISIHVQNNDSTSSKALLSNFPNLHVKASCPFHSLAYEIVCEAVIAKLKQIIHEELGCCHTNITESSSDASLLCFHFTWAYTE